MKSITYGEVDISQIAKIIENKVTSCPGEYELMIGTDSQNFDTTKMVLVIALHNVGHGGIFFYEVRNVHKITNIGQKLIYETTLSIELMQKLIAELDSLKEKGFDYEKYMSIGIHVDAGKNGPSRVVIPEVVGWIKACGFDVWFKPDSYAASSIANKYSK